MRENRDGFAAQGYLRYRLTGCLSTDVTDAAGTLALNVRQAAWSDELIRTLGAAPLALS